MAKKDTKKKKNGKKDKAPAGAVEAVEAVRSAVERSFAATAEGAQSLRGPAQEFAGELAGAVNRIREVLEDRVVDELKGLRRDLEGLAKRVADLERPGAAASSKPAASRAAAKKPAARRASTARSSSTAKPASSRRSTAKASRSTAKASGSTAKSSRSSTKSAASKPATKRRSS